jgi:hypothetical protein
MGLLSDADLAMMRDVIAQTLPDTCNVLSESLTPDGQGGVTSTWGTVAANVPCRLDSIVLRSNMLMPVAGAQRQAHQFELTTPYDTTISTGNRVEVGSSTYTVVSVNVNVSWKASGRAVLELI